MAVYKRAYRPYAGPLVPERSRFLVLTRYSLLEVFESRVFTALLVLCLVPFLVELAAIYVANSAAARALLRIPGQADPLRPEFFAATLTIQGVLGFLLTAWLAPTLVSPDLVNGALPLYLSRPLSRPEYLLGKAGVLFALLSLITWVPGLIVFALQASFGGPAWTWANLRVAGAIFVGAWIWIVVLSLLGLALSAWIKWRLVASGALFAVFFTGLAFGEVWGEVLRNPWGRLGNLFYLVGVIWRDLFLPQAPLFPQESVDGHAVGELPSWAAWLGLLAVCTFCTWLLDRRLRAREVVG